MRDENVWQRWLTMRKSYLTSKCVFSKKLTWYQEVNSKIYKWKSFWILIFDLLLRIRNQLFFNFWFDLNQNLRWRFRNPWPESIIWILISNRIKFYIKIESVTQKGQRNFRFKTKRNSKKIQNLIFMTNQESNFKVNFRFFKFELTTWHLVGL